MLLLRKLPVASGIPGLPSLAASAGPSLSLRREGVQEKLRGRNRKPAVEVHLLLALLEKQEALKVAAVPRALPSFCKESDWVGSRQGKDKTWRTMKNPLTPLRTLDLCWNHQNKQSPAKNHQTGPSPTSHQNYFS